MTSDLSYNSIWKKKKILNNLNWLQKNKNRFSEEQLKEVRKKFKVKKDFYNELLDSLEEQIKILNSKIDTK